MKTVYQVALEVLQQSGEGLTREELAQKVGAELGREVHPSSLKLTELALNGEIRREKHPKQVVVTQNVEVFFATGQNMQTNLFGTDSETGEHHGHKPIFENNEGRNLFTADHETDTTALYQTQ